MSHATGADFNPGVLLPDSSISLSGSYESVLFQTGTSGYTHRHGLHGENQVANARDADRLTGFGAGMAIRIPDLAMNEDLSLWSKLRLCGPKFSDKAHVASDYFASSGAYCDVHEEDGKEPKRDADGNG